MQNELNFNAKSGLNINLTNLLIMLLRIGLNGIIIKAGL